MSHCDRPDRIVSYPTAAPRELREGTDPCEACGAPIAPPETRAHLETDCGGALWKKRQLLERSAP